MPRCAKKKRFKFVVSDWKPIARPLTSAQMEMDQAYGQIRQRSVLPQRGDTTTPSSDISSSVFYYRPSDLWGFTSGSPQQNVPIRNVSTFNPYVMGDREENE